MIYFHITHNFLVIHCYFVGNDLRKIIKQAGFCYPYFNFKNIRPDKMSFVLLNIPGD